MDSEWLWVWAREFVGMVLYVQSYLNLLVAHETRNFNNALIKRQYPTASSHKYSYSIGEIGERVSFEVVLRYGYYICWSKCLVLAWSTQSRKCYVELILSLFLFYKVSLVTLSAYPLYILFWSRSRLFTDNLQAMLLSTDPPTVIRPSF